ncbi:MAG: hypothetical protein A2X35_00925 [Elusimicrobia bacterium GWA2_61_42]|nr:MAG: hypothetical protein A2X35_00925 [Elusimicrobia bacterium GWA2_61_42]OGR75223.1 MAG: hypothetical protein A2X38_04860 [Elusimicrobia bacterium GWC2_61_25]
MMREASCLSSSRKRPPPATGEAKSAAAAPEAQPKAARSRIVFAVAFTLDNIKPYAGPVFRAGKNTAVVKNFHGAVDI